MPFSMAVAAAILIHARRALCQSEESLFESMSSILSNMFIYRDEADARIWKPWPSSAFSSRSFLRSMEENSMVKTSCSLVSLRLASPRVVASID